MLRRWGGGEVGWPGRAASQPGSGGGGQKHTQSGTLWVHSRPHTSTPDKLPREAEPENPSGGSLFHPHPVG